MDYLSQIEGRIAKLRQELQELEVAAKVCRRLDAGASSIAQYFTDDPKDSPAPAGANGSGKDLTGKTVRESAEIILRESDEPLYYKAVFDKAIARGYSSGRKGKDGSPVSFWAILKRNREVFEPAGEGRFKLKGAK